MLQRYQAAIHLLGRRPLRAVSIALSRDLADISPPDEPNTEFVELTEQPFDNLDDVTKRLESLYGLLCEAEDRRGVFLAIYTRMTAAVRAAIQSGRFNQPAWMRDYTVSFADYYRRAFLAFENGDLEAVPRPWQIAFGMAGDNGGLIAQDAFLGINAHINYDLAYALFDVGIDPDRDRRLSDHLIINEILGQLIDAQQAALADLYAPGLATVDTTLGRLDEQLSLVSMDHGRWQAWQFAIVFSSFDHYPVARVSRWLHELIATGGAKFISSPPIDSRLLRELRNVERGVGLENALIQITERLDAS